MTIDPRGHDYPAPQINVLPFAEDLPTLFVKPAGLIDGWPPTQLTYLGVYLHHLECKTIVVEQHYVDRDYSDDLSLFYTRSLRDYPNHCQRLHFFREAFDDAQFQDLLRSANGGQLTQACASLQSTYLGFVVFRPLPGSPIGRTVLATFGDRAVDGSTRAFGAVRRYTVNLAGFELHVDGLAFQQQDRGVSACATTALWSALHRVAQMEELALPTPAAITQSASRYVLSGGRALPSDGLTPYQMCEAIRAAGLAPLVVSAVAPEEDKAEIAAYVNSGFPVVLAIHPIGSAEGHAVCAVGLKIGELPPRTDAAIGFRHAANALRAVYVHDDRLGPYAVADLMPYTVEIDGVAQVRTSLLIRWPSREEWELSLLKAAIIPVPVKLRLTATRMRTLGMSLAEWTGKAAVPELDGQIILNCRYSTAVSYKHTAFGFDLSDAGATKLATQVPLSRFIGLIEIASPGRPLFDVILDATETSANPSVLACVRRPGMASTASEPLAVLAKKLGGILIS